MKRIYLLLIPFIILLVHGCDDNKLDVYGGPEYVQFEQASVSFPVYAEGDGPQTYELVIGVTRVSNVDQTFTITVDTEKSTAVEGQDYIFAEKSVTIPAGKFVGSTTIKGVYENLESSGVDLALKLNITDPDKVHPDYGSEAVIHIYQKYIPTMSDIVGTYSAAELTYPTGALSSIYQITISQVEGSDNKVLITNIWRGGKSVEATINFSAATMKFDRNPIYTQAGADYYITFFDPAAGTYDTSKSISATCIFNGDIQIDPWLLTDAAGVYYNIFLGTYLSKN